MRRLLAALALVVMTATPALAQEAPQPTPQAPPPAVVNVQPNVTVDMPGDESPECSWRRPSTWWGCITGSAKKQVADSRETNIQKFISSYNSFLRTPDPFTNDRVRELWLYMAGPLALAIIGLLAFWASAKGAMGNPHHMSPGELWGRALIALVMASASIILIPWLIELSNMAAKGMAFVPLDPSQLRHAGGDGLGAGNIGVVDFIALLVFVPVVFLLLLFALLRWVLVIVWCIVAPSAAATYTYPGTEDYAFAYVKGLGALLAAPVADAFLLSVMWWLVITGHDIFPVSWGAWLDGLLITVLALSCLVVELWALKVAFGIHNFSGLKRAMRRGQYGTVTVIQQSGSRSADTWEAGARGRIGL